MGRITIIGGHIHPDQNGRIDSFGCYWWDEGIGSSLIDVGWLMSGRARWLDITQFLIRIDVFDESDSRLRVCLGVCDCVLLVALRTEPSGKV